ncbi:phosphoribosyltransferase family protein [Defluviimonas sp. WL0050]|uniref:Phosphoribosyltransferase family protein n=1 Tax=Albidovulum litorale TaxID=2984134 RepID=A0ABT2ZRB0_9RHOB|nr:phosphoribosyltransferase family protein [Defluviimonas sp. WL0050]MCV2873695.1 phosphoribosyltransferase family protein [Defluviimonas sp. WL0050]
MRYRDRTEAGERLAQELKALDLPDPVVLALPRGGVPVAYEVARELAAPLDLVMVRKIGVPSQPELAAGAVVNGANPEIVVNEEVARHARLVPADIERLAEAQLDLIRERRGLYLKGRVQVPLSGRTAVVVDDGIATGATMRAALKAVRRQAPARIVLAVPVAAPETLEAMKKEADLIVCPNVPTYLGAIGAFYVTFDQTSDDEVIRLLDAAAERPASGQ